MLVLAVDTATPAVTAGVLQLSPQRAPEVLAERVTVDARAHGELLMPSIRGLLQAAGLRMPDLDAVVCGAGPGPFTGLRVGMVTAAALGDALSIPVYPVASLDAVARQAGPGPALLVLTDARRREVYWARYDETGARVHGPGVCRPAEVPVDGAARVAGAAAELLAAPTVAVVQPQYPSAAGLVAVAAPAVLGGAAPGPLTPLYLRRPDAVEPGPAKQVSRV